MGLRPGRGLRPCRRRPHRHHRSGHLARAQATANLLVAVGSTAPSPAASYALPKPVTDVTSARALAATIEGDCAAAWRGVIGATDNTTIRNAALAGLSDSAVWLTSLKLAGKISSGDGAVPGGLTGRCRPDLAGHGDSGTTSPAELRR